MMAERLTEQQRQCAQVFGYLLISCGDQAATLGLKDRAASGKAGFSDLARLLIWAYTAPPSLDEAAAPDAGVLLSAAAPVLRLMGNDLSQVCGDLAPAQMHRGDLLAAAASVTGLPLADMMALIRAFGGPDGV